MNNSEDNHSTHHFVKESAKDIVDASDRAEPVDPASPAPPAPTEPPQVEKQDAKTEVRPRTTRASLTTRRVVQPSLDPVKVDPGNTDVSTPSAGVTADGVNLQVIFFNSIITACVIGIPIFIVLVIYIYRRRKGNAIYISFHLSHPSPFFFPFSNNHNIFLHVWCQEFVIFAPLICFSSFPIRFMKFYLFLTSLNLSFIFIS